MYRAFIVDDNSWDRKGIQELIDWNGMGVDVVGSFSNGKRALEKIAELSPHIIIADVAMPVMSGIEMAQKLKESNPEIKIIFMSSYSEFDFVKFAIDLDIYGYVLKPVEADELIKAVEKVIRVFREENSRLSEIEKMIEQINNTLPLVQEQFFRELIFNHFKDMEDVEKRLEFLRLDLLRYAGIQMLDIVLIDNGTTGGKISIVEKYLISYSLKAIIASHVSPGLGIFTAQISEKEYAVLLFRSSMPEDAEDTGAIDLAVSIYEEAAKKLSLYVKIGVSEITGTLADIPELYRQSKDAADTMFYGEGNPIIRYGEIMELQSGSREWKINMEDLYDEVRNILTNGNEADAEEFVGKYLTEGTFKSNEFIRNLAYSTVNAAQIVLMETGKSFGDVLGDETAVWRKLTDFDTILNVKQWILNILLSLQEGSNLRSSTRNGKIAEDIKEIIKKKYQEQITLKDIAELVFLSPKQANSIFRRETGKTIFDYLLEYRIETAKKLLKNPYSRIYQVSDDVGYKNKSHFCLLFRKYTGLTPTEYKNTTV